MSMAATSMSDMGATSMSARQLHGISSVLITDAPPDLPRKLARSRAGKFGSTARSTAGGLGSTKGFSTTKTLTGVSMPEVLQFESWWKEEGPSTLRHPPGSGTTTRRLNAQTGHGTSHVMVIHYFPEEQLFQVHIDDTIEPFTLAVTRPDGTSLQAWDLHVGARLDILGRPTTLMKASCETTIWIDKQAKNMLKTIKTLEKEVSKFQPLSLMVTTHGSTLLPHDPKGGPSSPQTQQP